jgi:cytidine deaminase
MAIDQKKLIDEARAAKQGCHSPYSKVKVGAALLLPSGEIVRGANVENASYGLTICAERAAIFAAVNAHGKQKFQAIAVTVQLPDPKATPGPRELSPCGACRQVMAEFMDDDALVIVDGSRTYTLGELLPDAFRLN